ncbi:MAG TPA: hypothetical protein VI455_02570 [Terriglobia bacterium]
MSLELTDPTYECDGFALTETGPDEPLAWYKVVGIELALFVGIVAPLICGAFLAR